MRLFPPSTLRLPHTINGNDSQSDLKAFKSNIYAIIQARNFGTNAPSDYTECHSCPILAWSHQTLNLLAWSHQTLNLLENQETVLGSDVLPFYAQQKLQDNEITVYHIHLPFGLGFSLVLDDCCLPQTLHACTPVALLIATMDWMEAVWRWESGAVGSCCSTRIERRGWVCWKNVERS